MATGGASSRCSRRRSSARQGPPGNAIPPGDLNAENDRADGRASFLRAPDTVAPPVALEPDNSPYRSPRSPATKRFQPASNLFPGPAALRSLGAGLSLRRLGCCPSQAGRARRASPARAGEDVTPCSGVDVGDAAGQGEDLAAG